MYWGYGLYVKMAEDEAVRVPIREDQLDIKYKLVSDENPYALEIGDNLLVLHIGQAQSILGQR